MSKQRNKVTKIFRLKPELAEGLEKRSEKESRTQTAILEKALQIYLATKAV
jgi:predicted DNA-binding protein